MGAAPAELTRDVDAATGRLLDAASTLDDADMRAPSQLPGWTRAHVLTHLARNADALVTLLGWAHGERTPMYESDEARDRDIDAGAKRDAAELLADVRASADRFVVALREVPEDGWDTVVEWRDGRRRPLTDVPWARLVETELHHADLGIGYSHQDWPERFTTRFLDELLQDVPRRADVPPFAVHRRGAEPPATSDGRPVVTGSATGLAGWLSGRSAGADLVTDPSGELPALPAWR